MHCRGGPLVFGGAGPQLDPSAGRGSARQPLPAAFPLAHSRFACMFRVGERPYKHDSVAVFDKSTLAAAFPTLKSCRITVVMR